MNTQRRKIGIIGAGMIDVSAATPLINTVA